MNGNLKINASVILGVVLQAVALVWYISKTDSKVEQLYSQFKEDNKKEVITNQVKMKLDLENLIADVNELQKEMRQMNKKDKEIVKQNKAIERQHKQLFSLIEGNTNNNSSGYSYGD